MMSLADRIKMGLVFSPDDGGGGGGDLADPDDNPDLDNDDDPDLDAEADPEPEPEPEPEEDDDPDGSKAVSAATEGYRNRLKALGGIFDEKGAFLGWQNSGLGAAAGTGTGSTADDIDVDQKIARAVAPLTTGRVIDRVVGANPVFGKYRREVEAMLDARPDYPVSDASVIGLFQYFRGQGVDIEVAQAVADAKVKSKTTGRKIAAGAAAASDTSASSGKPAPKNAKITPEIAQKAKAWGLDPQDFANKVAAHKALPK